MHTFLSFFAWPDGSSWSNVTAMPLCGVVAVVFAFVFRDHIGKALRSWWHRHLGHADELAGLKAELRAHADLLDHETPGGLGAVMAELRDLKAEVKAQAAGMTALASIARGAGPAPEAAPPAPAGGPGTSGKRSASGMGTRMAPKQGGTTPMQKKATGKTDGGQP